MKTIILLSFGLFMSAFSDLKIDFGNGKAGADWVIINDDVMGGRSVASVFLNDGSVVFEGKISLENSGGFASWRSPVSELDLSEFRTVTIRYRTSERIFAFVLEDNLTYYRPNYKHDLNADNSDWQEITMKLADFKASVLGRPTGASLTSAQLKGMKRMGFILNDKQAGAFTLEVDYILFR